MTGDDLTAARERLGLSVLDVAGILNVNASTVHRWAARGPVEIRVDPLHFLFLLQLLGLSAHRLAVTYGAHLRAALEQPPGYALHVLLSIAFEKWTVSDAS